MEDLFGPTPSNSPQSDLICNFAVSIESLDRMAQDMAEDTPFEVSDLGSRIFAHESAFSRYFRDTVLTKLIPDYMPEAEDQFLTSGQIRLGTALKEIAMNIVDYEIWGLSGEQKEALEEGAPMKKSDIAHPQNFALQCTVTLQGTELLLQFSPLQNTPTDFPDQWNHQEPAASRIDIAEIDPDDLDAMLAAIDASSKGTTLAKEVFREARIVGEESGRMLVFAGDISEALAA